MQMIMFKGDILLSAANYTAERRQVRFEGSTRMKTNGTTHTHNTSESKLNIKAKFCFSNGTNSAYILQVFAVCVETFEF